MDLPDPSYQSCLPETMSLSLNKGVVATGTDLQHAAAEPHRILVPVIIDENIPYPDSLAKNAAAFFSISLSSFNRRFSLRRRLSSSISGD